MNDRGTTNDHESQSHERAAQNDEPAQVVPAKREGEVVDGAGKPLDERDNRSPLDGLMEG